MTESPPTIEQAGGYPLPPGLLHDLRTPLNHILGYSELLVEQAEETGQDNLVPYLEKVRAAGHRLLSLINDNFRSVRSDRAPARHVEPVSPPEAELQGEAPTSDPGWGSILVVDDIEGNRDVLSQLLRRQGYSVVTAENGGQALDLLGASAFDLVLLDIMMPKMDGYEVLRRLKADDRLRHIPVVMISAIHEVDAVARCIEMGAEDYLPKPFDPTLLQARIGAAIAKKRARDRETLLFEVLQQNHLRLQELEGKRDVLAATAVQELRAPLEAVIAEMLTLECSVGLTEPQRQMVCNVVASGRKVLGVMDRGHGGTELNGGSPQFDG